MAGESKIWEKIKRKKNRTDLTLKDVRKLLEKVGFYLARQNSSHFHFKHDELSMLLTIPAHRESDKIKGVYINDIYNRIIENGLETLL